MKQWEIWAVDVAHDTHPCVVISPAARAENEDVEDLNLLQCSSQRAGRPARTHEILLDTEDGLDWETLCRCDLIHLAARGECQRRIGLVTRERRQAIGRKLVQLFGLLS